MACKFYDSNKTSTQIYVKYGYPVASNITGFITLSSINENVNSPITSELFINEILFSELFPPGGESKAVRFLTEVSYILLQFYAASRDRKSKVTGNSTHFLTLYFSASVVNLRTFHKYTHSKMIIKLRSF